MLRIPALGALVILIVAVFGFLFFSIDAVHEKDVEKLKMAEASQPVFALIYIAERKGYFREENLEITYDSYTSGRDALNSVIAGKNDIATVYETPVVIKSYEGNQLTIITELHNSNKNTALVARLDRGIKTVSDLKGKSIGVTLNTNAAFFLNQYLSSHGINIKDVKLVPTPPLKMASVLSGGEVDAIAVWNPHLYNARQSLPRHATITFNSDVYTELSVLALKREVARKRPEAVKRLLRALLRAERFLENNPKEALDLVVTSLPENVSHMTRKVWKDFNTKLRLSNILKTILEEEADWFRQTGRFSGPTPDFNEVIDADYLKEVNPVAVTLR